MAKFNWKKANVSSIVRRKGINEISPNRGANAIKTLRPRSFNAKQTIAEAQERSVRLRKRKITLPTINFGKRPLND